MDALKSVVDIFSVALRVCCKALPKIWYWLLAYGGLLVLLSIIIALNAPYLVEGVYQVRSLMMMLVETTIVIAVTCYLKSIILSELYHASIQTEVSSTVLLKNVLEKLPSILIVSFIVWLSVNLGLLLLVVPGIVLGVLLYLALPLVTIDGHSPFSAVRRSVQLISKNSWLLVFIALTILATIHYGLIWISIMIIAKYLMQYQKMLPILPALKMLFLPIYLSFMVVFLANLKQQDSQAASE